MLKGKVPGFILWILFFSLSGCSNQRLYKDTEVLMGTFVEVISAQKEAAGIVFTEIRRVENLLSKYKPESEISRLNRLGELKVSPDTYYVLKKSKEFFEASAGAFDISVGPLVDIWGFTDKEYSLPKEQEVKLALSLVGSDKIIFNEENNVVKFTIPGMKLDLGAIAKGFALDCAVKRLRQNQVKSCLINAGGQVCALGDKLGVPWEIVIQNPRGRDFSGTLKLKDSSVATSGDYQQYFVRDGRRYAHILDPRTGRPAQSGVISVTVIAKDGLTADALATAMFVLGKEKGAALLKQFPEAEARIIEEKDVQSRQ